MQRQILREWLFEASHQEIYYEYLQEWEQLHPQLITNPEQAYARFQSQINRCVSQSLPKKQPNRFLTVKFIAACLTAVILSLTGLWTLQETIFYKTESTNYGETKSLELPDGSQVILNANTQLTYPRFGFGKTDRQVMLKGEAEFDVRHTENQLRFVVNMERDVRIVVLGTKFVVNARPRGTQVILSRGKVQLNYAYRQTRQSITMTPGEQVRLSANTPPQRSIAVNRSSVTNWKEHLYEFNKTPLPEVVNLLEDNFGLKVQLSPEMTTKTITGQFHANTGDELLKALSELYNVQIQKSGNSVVLKPAIYAAE